MGDVCCSLPAASQLLYDGLHVWRPAGKRCTSWLALRLARAECVQPACRRRCTQASTYMDRAWVYLVGTAIWVSADILLCFFGDAM